MVLQFASSYVGDLTTSLVLEKALYKPTGQWTRADEMRVAAILKREGFVQCRSWVGPKRLRAWVRPTSGRSQDNGCPKNSPLEGPTDQLGQPPTEEEEESKKRARAGRARVLVGPGGPGRLVP